MPEYCNISKIFNKHLTIWQILIGYTNVRAKERLRYLKFKQNMVYSYVIPKISAIIVAYM